MSMIENDNDNVTEEEFGQDMPWEEGQQTQQTQQAATPSGFFAGMETTGEVGSAATSTEEMSFSRSFPKPEYRILKMV